LFGGCANSGEPWDLSDVAQIYGGADWLIWVTWVMGVTSVRGTNAAVLTQPEGYKTT